MTGKTVVMKRGVSEVRNDDDKEDIMLSCTEVEKEKCVERWVGE